MVEFAPVLSASIKLRTVPFTVHFGQAGMLLSDVLRPAGELGFRATTKLIRISLLGFQMGVIFRTAVIEVGSKLRVVVVEAASREGGQPQLVQEIRNMKAFTVRC